jgi:putative NADPH-quinone reductase
MANVLLYYAHPGHKRSNANRKMFNASHRVDGISIVDLYADYPRFNVDIDIEQGRLLKHDVIIFQCPMFWYSTPSLVKEWIDLVLEHEFAYGVGGDKLQGKVMQLAVTTAGPQEAYSRTGYQHYPIRTFLTPLEQTARLCHMRFPAPYVLFGALRAKENQLEAHVDGYVRLLKAYRDDTIDLERAIAADVIGFDSLPINTVS